MTQASDTSTLADARGHRTHPLTAVLQGLLWGTAVAAALGWQVIGGDRDWHTLLIVPGGFVVGVLAGWVSWLVTRYVIDDAEIRVDRGVLFRSSRRIPFTRLQSVDISEPLVARLFGLCELTLEMAGGADSRTRLRFLTSTEAHRLRRLLLARAHGSEATAALDAPRDVLHTVPPAQIVIGTLLSLDFIATAAGAAASAVAVVLTQGTWTAVGVAVGILVPALLSILRMIGDRIIAQWGFTVSRGSRGLRIDRGLLSRSSQTIPYDRVQGIAIVEPVVWRLFGWSRLSVDIAGYGRNADEDGGVSSTTLLPIAGRTPARRLIDELIPDPARGHGHRVRPPRRSAVFAPIGWRYRWFSATTDTASAARGWFTHRIAVIPLHKVQSVQLVQGPVSRRLHLASVELQTPDGPVRVRIDHLDERVARDLAFDQLEAIRRARRLHRRQPPLVASSAPASNDPHISRESSQPSGSTTFLGEP